MNSQIFDSKNSKSTNYLEQTAKKFIAIVDIQTQNEIKNVCSLNDSPYFIHKVNLDYFNKKF